MSRIEPMKNINSEADWMTTGVETNRRTSNNNCLIYIYDEDTTSKKWQDFRRLFEVALSAKDYLVLIDMAIKEIANHPDNPEFFGDICPEAIMLGAVTALFTDNEKLAAEMNMSNIYSNCATFSNRTNANVNINRLGVLRWTVHSKVEM